MEQLRAVSYSRRIALAETTWAIPNLSNKQIDKAGRSLLNFEQPDELWRESYETVNHWRSCHAFPLHEIANILKSMSKSIDANSVSAYRLKRILSMLLKMMRKKNLQLSKIQDIGGCRAIVDDISHVSALFDKLTTGSIEHERKDVDDYITTPRESGYRSVHLIYKYFSQNEPRSQWNGLRIEVQIRTRLQHAWATAVETVDTFTDQNLKSGKGSPNWLRFFALISSKIAAREGSPQIPGTPTNSGELADELLDLSVKLDVVETLKAFNLATSLEDLRDPFYFLLDLRIAEKSSIRMRAFRRSQLPEAERALADAESRIKGDSSANVVLVSADSILALKRAYPNYFADTRLFLDLLDETLGI